MTAAMFISLHSALALALFFSVNWIGKHAVEFGYSSTTLFSDPNQSIGLNFFIKALSPAIFTVIVAAVFVSVGRPDLRIGLYKVVIIYFGIRLVAIFLLDRQVLVSWPRFFIYAFSGVAAAYLAHEKLIIPNRSLLPDLEQAGNELWLAIGAFLYAVFNQVSISEGPSARRRNQFIAKSYYFIQSKFGKIIQQSVDSDVKKLVIYSIAVYENYCRPPAIRSFERFIWWRPVKTTGLMQFSSHMILSDEQSVHLAIDRISSTFDAQLSGNEDLPSAVWNTISDYNKDENYISNVCEIMEVIAKRVDVEFLPIYKSIYGSSS